MSSFCQPLDENPPSCRKRQVGGLPTSLLFIFDSSIAFACSNMGTAFEREGFMVTGQFSEYGICLEADTFLKGRLRVEDSHYSFFL
jgi:hypothetical protein